MRMRFQDLLSMVFERRGVPMTVMLDPWTLQLRVRIEGHLLDGSVYWVRELWQREVLQLLLIRRSCHRFDWLSCICLVVAGEHLSHLTVPRRAQRWMELLMQLSSLKLAFKFSYQVLFFHVDFLELVAQYGGCLLMWKATDQGSALYDVRS